jgi:hypothetical protein
VDYGPERVQWTVCQLALDEKEAQLLWEFLASQSASDERRTWFMDNITGLCWDSNAQLKKETIGQLSMRAFELRPGQHNAKHDEDEEKKGEPGNGKWEIGSADDSDESDLDDKPQAATERQRIVITDHPSWIAATNWSLPEIVTDVLCSFGFLHPQVRKTVRPTLIRPDEVMDLVIDAHKQHKHPEAKDCGHCLAFQDGHGLLALDNRFM